MKIKYLSPLLAAVALLAIETPVAQSIDSSWLSYCKRVRNDVRNTLNTHKSSSSSSSAGGNLGAKFPIKGVPISWDIGGNSARSSSQTSTVNKEDIALYRERDCEQVLKAYAEITVAEIEANANVKIAEILSNTQIETTDRKEQGETDRTRLETRAYKYDSDNRVRMKELETDAQKTQSRHGLIGNAIGAVSGVITQGIKSSGETKQAEILAGRQPQNQHQPQNQYQPQPQRQSYQQAYNPYNNSNRAKLEAGRLVVTQCNPRTSALIVFPDENICVQPVGPLKAGGRYYFNVNTGKIVRRRPW